MTVILVVLLQNRTFKEYRETLAVVGCDNYKDSESKTTFLTCDNEKQFSTPSESSYLTDNLQCMFFFIIKFTLIFFGVCLITLIIECKFLVNTFYYF